MERTYRLTFWSGQDDVEAVTIFQKVWEKSLVIVNGMESPTHIGSWDLVDTFDYYG
jgi:hypothetical protein